MKQRLIELISRSPELLETAHICREFQLPNFYIAGGAITQMIWNELSGRPLLDKVKDLDIVYFDSGGAIDESTYEQSIASVLSHDIPIDVKNQAIVHQWYPQKFGQIIEPYMSSEQGIDSWLSAFAIGFRIDACGKPELYTPSGLKDAFQMLVRPNKVAMTKASYLKMTKSFKARWPDIKVLPWTTLEQEIL